MIGSGWNEIYNYGTSGSFNKSGGLNDYINNNVYQNVVEMERMYKEEIYRLKREIDSYRMMSQVVYTNTIPVKENNKDEKKSKLQSLIAHYYNKNKK